MPSDVNLSSLPEHVTGRVAQTIDSQDASGYGEVSGPMTVAASKEALSAVFWALLVVHNTGMGSAA